MRLGGLRFFDAAGGTAIPAMLHDDVDALAVTRQVFSQRAADVFRHGRILDFAERLCGFLRHSRIDAGHHSLRPVPQSNDSTRKWAASNRLLHEFQSSGTVVLSRESKKALLTPFLVVKMRFAIGSAVLLTPMIPITGGALIALLRATAFVHGYSS